MAWTIPFESTSGKKYRIEISGGDGTLKGAAQPFMLEQDDDEDFFKPVRTATGYITVVCSFDEIKAIVAGTSPVNRPVTLYEIIETSTTDDDGEVVVDTDEVVVWKGYVRCETFDFEYSPFSQEFQIPICNNLELIYDITIDKSTLNKPSLAKLLAEFALGYEYIYTPNNVTSFLWSMGIDKTNYLSERDEVDADGSWYEMDNYGTLLEDICYLYGWQCQEYGNNLVFTSNDDCESYNVWTLSAKGYTDLIETVSREELNLPQIVSPDNSVSVIPGKKSVSIEANTNPFDENIYSFNENTDLDFSGSYQEHSFDTYASKRYRIRGVQTGKYIKGHQYVAGSSTEVDKNNIKYLNAVAGSRAYEGGSLTNEIIYGDTAHLDDYEKEWHSRIILVNSTSSASGLPLLEISPIMPVAYFHYSFLVFKCTAKYSDDPDEVIDKDFTGSVVGTIYSDAFSEGRKTLGLVFEDGKLKSETFDIDWGQIDGTAVEWRGTSNDYSSLPITIKIWYILGSDGNRFNGYLSLESFSISALYWPLYTYNKDEKNTYYKDLENNFQDDVSVKCNLTPGKYGQIGKGVVDASPHSTRPEVYLGERMATYYSKSHAMYKIVVRGTEYINPINTIEVDGVECAIIGQSLDYRYEELTLTLLALT